MHQPAQVVAADVDRRKRLLFTKRIKKILPVQSPWQTSLQTKATKKLDFRNWNHTDAFNQGTYLLMEK